MYKIAVGVVFALVSVTPTRGRAQSAPPPLPRLIEMRGDTVFMVKPKLLRFKGPIAVSPTPTPDSPDTLKVQFVGDSAVTLNTRTVMYYSRVEAMELRRMVFLSSLIPPKKPNLW